MKKRKRLINQTYKLPENEIDIVEKLLEKQRLAKEIIHTLAQLKKEYEKDLEEIRKYLEREYEK